MARSPNYPQLNLGEAIERVRQVYKVGHTHKADKEVVAKSLGYSSINGASLAVISTLKRYELIQDEGDGLKVSDDAVAILELPKGDPERAKAFRAAAFAPQLFAEIHEVYGDHLPGDVHLRHFLIKKKFLPKAADDVIRVYRENLELVTEETKGYNAGDTKADEEQSPMSQETPPQPPIGSSFSKEALQRQFAHNKIGADLYALGIPIPQDRFTEDLNYRISEDCKVRLLFEGEITREAIVKLAKYLALAKDDYPSTGEASKSTQEPEDQSIDELFK